MKRSTILVSLALSFASLSAAAECQGDACDNLRIQQTENCAVIQNTHPNQAIKVRSLDEQRDYQWVVPANGELQAISADGFCPPDWYKVGQIALFEDE